MQEENPPQMQHVIQVYQYLNDQALPIDQFIDAYLIYPFTDAFIEAACQLSNELLLHYYSALTEHLPPNQPTVARVEHLIAMMAHQINVRIRVRYLFVRSCRKLVEQQMGNDVVNNESFAIRVALWIAFFSFLLMVVVLLRVETGFRETEWRVIVGFCGVTWVASWGGLIFAHRLKNDFYYSRMKDTGI